MTGWLDCPHCAEILAGEQCRLCGEYPDTPEWTVTAPGFNHFLGPFCPPCRERMEESIHEMVPG